MLRTIICGACYTPSRMLAANCLTLEQAKCIHCTMNVTETLGHRFWHCPNWKSYREARNLGAENFDEASWPRALTRCGVCPANLSLISAEKVCQIQLMMIEITEAVSQDKDAQRQFKTARRPNGKKARDENLYIQLQQVMSGN